MAKKLSREQRLAEYLDQLLAGKEIFLAEADRDLEAELEFARKMLSNRDEPPQDFRNALKERLLRKIALGTEMEVAEKQPGFWQRIKDFGSNMQAVRIAAAVTMVLIVILGGTIWYRYSQSQQQMFTASSPAPSLEKAAGEYSVNLPASNVPRDMVIQLDTQLSSTPGKAVIYRVAAPHVTSESVKELGEKLGFKGEAVYEDEGRKITMQDGSGVDARQLNVWVASGAVEYGYTDPDRLYPSQAQSLPSKNEAKQAAYSFLSNAGLIPREYGNYSGIERDIEVVPGNYPVADITNETDYWRVIFPYGTQGIRFAGPGAIIEVTVGDSREILRVIWAWRDLVPLDDQNIIPEAQAFDNLVTGNGSLIVPSNTARLNVTGVDIVYWIEDYTRSQDYVLPVYQFQGESSDNNGRYLEDVNAWTKAVY